MFFFDLEEEDSVLVQVVSGTILVLRGYEIADKTNLTIGSFILFEDEFGIGQPAQILKYSKALKLIHQNNDGQMVTDFGTQTHSKVLLHLSENIQVHDILLALKKSLQIIKEKEKNVLFHIRRALTYMDRSNRRATRNRIRAGVAVGKPRQVADWAELPMTHILPRYLFRRGRGAPLCDRNVSVEMVAIGNNGTAVPKHVMDTLEHCSYTKAVRVLLQQVFSREVLATHSLTGKPSPAFANKAPRPRLDPKKVEDIIHVILKHCSVKVCYIRKVITTKLADEHKMYKQRLNRARPHSM